MSKIWKSDGPETKYLENLFRSKKLNDNSKPAVVQKTYPIFSGFSPAVFRKNFANTKMKCCLHNTPRGELTVMDMINGPTEDENDDDMNGIDELDGDEATPVKLQKFSSSEGAIVDFIHPPIIPCVYTDGVTKQKKCLIVLMLYTGVKEIDVDIKTKINSSEQILKLTYKWPASMFQVNKMFKNDQDGKMLSALIDPKVLAVEAALQRYRDNIDQAPCAIIEAKLPIEVNIDPQTWVKTVNKKVDGGVIVFLEFDAIRKSYSICKNEKTLKIE